MASPAWQPGPGHPPPEPLIRYSLNSTLLAVGVSTWEQASTSATVTLLLVVQQVGLSVLQERTYSSVEVPGGGPPAPSGAAGRWWFWPTWVSCARGAPSPVLQTS